MKSSSTRQARLLGSFLELVRIDGESGKENAVAEALRRRLADLGLSAVVDDAGATFGGACGNVIAHVPGRTEAPALLLCAHMDTIQPTAGLKPIVAENGLVTSDGTTILGADDRAGVAIILQILHELQADRISHGPLDIVFTVAEEHGMYGAKALDRAHLRASQGLVFDSSAPCGSFVAEAPGAAAFHAVFKGRAAHAAVSPEKGIHAIQIAATGISRLKLGRWGTAGMVNVGTIHGGTAINVVPDRVEVCGEYRSPDREEFAAQKQHIEETFTKASQEAGGTVEISWETKYDGFSLKLESEFLRAVSQGIKAAGYEPRPLRYPGGSDANVFNARGIACVNLGLGYRNVHSLQEAMPIQCLFDGVSVGLGIIQAVAEQRTSIAQS